VGVVSKADIIQAIAHTNAGRIAHFARRIRELDLDPKDYVIVILGVDDPIGSLFVEQVMPDNDAMWKEIRSKGERPYARGLVNRRFIQGALDILSPNSNSSSATALRDVPGIAVVIIDFEASGVLEIDESLMPEMN
jgi:hypothetical protein